MMRTVPLPPLRGSLFVLAGSASAQDYPTRPVTMVIPFAAGGPTDVLGRVVGARMSETLGQQVVIENVGGAGGMTGSKRVADAAPDGYTFVLGTVGTHAQGQTLYKRPLYNSQTDFTPVALLAAGSDRADRAQGSAGERLQGVRRLRQGEPGQDAVRLGRRGLGDASRLRAAQLRARHQHHARPVTAAPARRCRICRPDASTSCARSSSTAKPQIDGGTVKALAIIDAQRSPALPNLPTAEEQGTKDLEAYTWNAIFLPKNAPQAIVDRLNAAAVEAIKTPAVRDRLAGLGAEIATDDRDHAGISRQVRQERDREMGGADQGERRVGGVGLVSHR